MKKINMYFFGESKISLLDALYFYGTQIGILGTITLIVISGGY